MFQLIIADTTFKCSLHDKRLKDISQSTSGPEVRVGHLQSPEAAALTLSQPREYRTTCGRTERWGGTRGVYGLTEDL